MLFPSRSCSELEHPSRAWLCSHPTGHTRGCCSHCQRDKGTHTNTQTGNNITAAPGITAGSGCAAFQGKPHVEQCGMAQMEPLKSRVTTGIPGERLAQPFQASEHRKSLPSEATICVVTASVRLPAHRAPERVTQSDILRPAATASNRFRRTDTRHFKAAKHQFHKSPH